MTSAGSPNRAVLKAVAERIEELLSEVVFVGGQVVELLITDPAAVRIRPTKDVDAIVEVTSRPEYREMEESLRQRGFSNDLSEGAPICRWKTSDGYVLDLMPVDESILGFSNRWYPEAVARAEPYQLNERLSIRIPPPSVFLATKLEAFGGRGGGDLLGSHDLEDVITLVAGRPEIVAEVSAEADPLRLWIRERIDRVVRSSDFSYALQGALPDAALLPEYMKDVQERLESLASNH